MFRPLLAAALLTLAAGPAAARQATTDPYAAPATAEATAPAPARAPLKIGGGGVRIGEDPADAPRTAGGSSVWGVAGALALVLGLFAAGVKWFGGTKLAAAAAGGGPCEVLAKVKLEARASMHVVRVGGRVVLVGSSGDGLTALGEIDDPVEAEALAAACRVAPAGGLRRAGGEARESFRTVFGRAAARPAAPSAAASLGAERDVSDAERRLAARLRPAGAVR